MPERNLRNRICCWRAGGAFSALGLRTTHLEGSASYLSRVSRRRCLTRPCSSSSSLAPKHEIPGCSPLCARRQSASRGHQLRHHQGPSALVRHVDSRAVSCVKRVSSSIVCSPACLPVPLVAPTAMARRVRAVARLRAVQPARRLLVRLPQARPHPQVLSSSAAGQRKGGHSRPTVIHAPGRQPTGLSVAVPFHPRRSNLGRRRCRLSCPANGCLSSHEACA